MIWLLLWACAEDPCAPMCDAAATAWGACLAERDAAWPDAGWADEADFLDGCGTWAWAQRKLARDAGDVDVDAICTDRTSTISAAADPCDVTRLDWDGPAF